MRLTGILLLALRLCGIEKITPPLAPPQEGRCDDGEVQNNSDIHEHGHTACSSPAYLH